MAAEEVAEGSKGEVEEGEKCGCGFTAPRERREAA